MAIDLDYELQNVLRDDLRTNLTDHNSDNRVGTYQVFVGYPKVRIEKNSFPRIIIDTISETEDIIDLAENTLKVTRCQIRLETWDADRDELIVTISDIKYSSGKLLDYLKTEVKNQIRGNLSNYRGANYNFFNLRIVPGLNKRKDPTDDRIMFMTFDVMFDSTMNNE